LSASRSPALAPCGIPDEPELAGAAPPELPEAPDVVLLDEPPELPELAPLDALLPPEVWVVAELEAFEPHAARARAAATRAAGASRRMDVLMPACIEAPRLRGEMTFVPH